MDELFDDLGFLLTRTSGLVVQAVNAALGDLGLRVRSYSVLLLACDTPGGLSQRDVADVLGLDPSQVVALVDELARAGLVTRETSPLDRRARLVVATAAGRRTRRHAAMRAGVGQQQVLEQLDDAEQATLRTLLTRVLTELGEDQASA